MVAGCQKMKSEVQQWYLDDFRQRLKSTSGIWMTICHRVNKI